VPIAGRGGVSPIGTVSPNTGASANTNSAYAAGGFASGVNYQGTETSYTLQNTDYQGLVLFNTASAVAVTLNYGLGENFTATILNVSTGAITLTPIAPPPDSVSPLYLVNGATSLALPSGAGCVVAFAARQWYAYVGATFIPVVPVTFNPVTNEWLTGYNATTGAFSASQPAFSNISGNLAESQLPTAGLTQVVTLAKLTSGGSNGSASFTNGILTAYTAPS
jgi:hypothetical protein